MKRWNIEQGCKNLLQIIAVLGTYTQKDFVLSAKVQKCYFSWDLPNYLIDFLQNSYMSQHLIESFNQGKYSQG